MTTPAVSGYAWMSRNLDKFFRSEANSGVVDDYVKADAITLAERMIHDEILASHVHWCVKSTVIDDVGGSLGADEDYQVRRLLFDTDLGITDLAKVARLWRVDAGAATIPVRIHYIPDDSGSEFIQTTGSLVGTGAEFWTETGAFNVSSVWEMGILLYNWGLAKEGGHLKVDYWWTPPLVEADWFSEVDASGNFSKAPPFPRAMWPYILEYAKWVVADTTGDIAKSRALARRWSSKGGMQEKVREFLGQFQTSGAEYVRDTFQGGG